MYTESRHCFRCGEEIKEDEIYEDEEDEIYCSQSCMDLEEVAMDKASREGLRNTFIVIIIVTILFILSI